MRIHDLAWSLCVICCLCSVWSCLGLMLVRGKILWKMFHFNHGYVTCLYVPFYLVGDACAQIVAILLVYVSILACCIVLCIFEKHMLAFVDLIHALPTRGRKVPNSCFQGDLCIKKLGEMHLFRGSLHSCIWELFFAWILVCSFFDGVEPFCLTLRSRQFLEHFISVVSSRCPCLRGPRFFSLKWSFLGFCLAFDHLFEFYFISFLFLFSLNWLLVCVVNALIKGEIEDRSVQGPVDGRSWLWWVIDNVVWTDS
jgi:hypothetical protein